MDAEGVRRNREGGRPEGQALATGKPLAMCESLQDGVIKWFWPGRHTIPNLPVTWKTKAGRTSQTMETKGYKRF